jgi:hypothetical protein
LRAGLREAASWNTQLACAGLGYNKENLQIDYSIGSVLKGEKLTVHTFGLGIIF